MFKKNIWDFWADKYESLWVQKYSLGPTRKAIINSLLPILKKNKKYKILDMGCGTGQLLRELQSNFYDFDIEYMGVDASSNMIDIARTKDVKTTYYTCSIEELKVSIEEFDIIFCSHSFPYYLEKDKAVDKFHSLLKKDGILFLAQASANSVYDTFAMFFVKFTTSKATYPSINSLLTLTKGKFIKMYIVKIKEQFYMPTIALFILKKEVTK
ncbi:MAG: class I SAM-dependent methyltransferase [Clostridiaceae bacterium]|nr:class I SAM-dependent methyltransferase [Clostridiaceae bacterium]